jgi:putative zinc ribbon protein
MASATAQECSTSGCTNPVAFTTRSRPAWCSECIDDMLREGGLEPVEPFTGPRAMRLTACLACGVQAHYRLEYTVAKNAVGEKTCRACYWRSWATERRNRPSNEFIRTMLELLGKYAPEQILEAVPTPEVREFLESGWWPLERIVAHLDKCNFKLVTTLDDVNDSDSTVVAQCLTCKKISANRINDVGCTCSRNTRSSNPAAPRAGRVLLTESQSPALQWWDHERNDEATLRTVTVRATRVCHWVCPDCERHFEAKVSEMTAQPSCPDCMSRRRKEWQEEHKRWKVTPIADVPELATAWAEDANPRDVMVADWGLRRFRCPKGHHPRINPLRFLEAGCPHCRSAQTARTGRRWLADTLPEIASQWHPTRNGKLTPQNVVWDSKRTVWWRADCCGHEWQETVRNRDKYERLRCPRCRTILGSLAWHDPGLAAEWSTANPVSAWRVRPHAATTFSPEWICATNPAHVWSAPLSTRSDGAECPECREVGKSRIELDHYRAAVEAFGQARSGLTLREDAFTSRTSWTADISVDVNGVVLVIEYDGMYWHSAPAKALIDERKSKDLLGAGYVVVRLREDDLPPLTVTHPRYREIRVYSAAPQPRAVMEEIRNWMAGLTSR